MKKSHAFPNFQNLADNMIRHAILFTALFLFAVPASAQTVDSISGKRVVFLGDSITQAGEYISIASYQLQKLHPQKEFSFYGLGLSSETVSGLSEENHANGAFPRPCLFERLGRLLERAKPDVVIACYGMNDGIYQPLDDQRFDAFKTGITNLIRQCQAGGAKEIILLTPPIYDFSAQAGEFNYDSVLTAYAAWEMSLKMPHVHVIDLHTEMRHARDAQTEPFSKDRVHPGEEGHLVIAKALLKGLGCAAPEESVATIKADPLFKLIDEQRQLRSSHWMKHIGYTREATFQPQPLGDVETEWVKLQQKIDVLRRKQ
jgi:lysophospholipase L1-like esterase